MMPLGLFELAQKVLASYKLRIGVSLSPTDILLSHLAYLVEMISSLFIFFILLCIVVFLLSIVDVTRLK